MTSEHASLPADPASFLARLTADVRAAVAAGILPPGVTIVASDTAPATAWHAGARL